MNEYFDTAAEMQSFEKASGRKIAPTVKEMITLMGELINRAYAQDVADGRKAVQA